MRFCPFCAQENADDTRECVHCGKRLPAPRTPPPRAPSAASSSRPPSQQVRPRIQPRPASGARPLRPASRPAVSPPLEAQADIEGPTQTMPPPSVAARAPTASPRLGFHAAEPSADATTTEHVLPPVRPVAIEDSGRRETRPLNVASARSVGLAPTLAAPATRPKPRPPSEDDMVTVPTPRVDASQDESSAQTIERGFEAPALVRARPNDRTLRPEDDMVTMVDGPAGATPEPETNQIPLPPVAPPPVALPPVVLPPVESTDLTLTPVFPTQAVVPMPPVPKTKKGVRSIIDAVLYLPPLAKAILARKKAQATIRNLLHGDQRILDQVLRELGRAAREAELDVPAVADEMRRVRAEEERRASAEAELRELAEKTEEEAQRWQDDEAARKADLEEREARIHASEEELKKLGDDRRRHETERARLDLTIRGLEKRAAQEDARAAKADATPPEKGGGPHTAANARASAEALRKEAAALGPARDEARSLVESIETPIAELTQRILDQRSELALKRKELVEALATHKKALADLEVAKRRAEAKRDGAEREMSQRFVSAGTLLNLNRVDDPRFTELYARIDELKSGVNAREAMILRLESERRSYDKAAVQKGLLALGVTFGTLILLAIILAVALSR